MLEPRNIAKRFVTQYNLQPRFNIFQLVEELGGTIIYDGNLSVDAYVIKRSSRFSIVVNPYVSDKRQRFSIAHELGHLYLHLNYSNKRVWEQLDVCDSLMFRYGHDQEELEANEFAAEVLMPEEYFCKYVKFYSENNIVDISRLASKFGVSKDAIIYRGHKLGYWDMNQ